MQLAFSSLHSHTHTHTHSHTSSDIWPVAFVVMSGSHCRVILLGQIFKKIITEEEMFLWAEQRVTIKRRRRETGVETRINYNHIWMAKIDWFMVRFSSWSASIILFALPKVSFSQNIAFYRSFSPFSFLFFEGPTLSFPSPGAIEQCYASGWHK